MHRIEQHTTVIKLSLIVMVIMTCAVAMPAETSRVLENASNAVVLLLSTETDYTMLKYCEAANGIIISSDGYIITVSHGLTGSVPDVYVGNERYAGKIVYNDKKYDFAMIKIDATHPLPFIKFASDNTIRQNVYLVGKRKRNREIFMSQGILNVKGINMSSKEISWIKTHINENRNVDYAVNNGILHTAHFFVGLSGCPLLNENGEVIAMNTGLIGKEEQRITLALELVCFLPVIEQVTSAPDKPIAINPCGNDVDLKNPLDRVGWIMNGLFHYCTLLGKDTSRLSVVRDEIEARAKQKILVDKTPPKDAIQWAWKAFLTESYKMR